MGSILGVSEMILPQNSRTQCDIVIENDICVCFYEALYVALVQSTPTQIQLVHDLLDKYDKKAKPMWDNSKPINVSFSMDLYQILELNEPQQYILLNAWIIEINGQNLPEKNENKNVLEDLQKFIQYPKMRISEDEADEMKQILRIFF
ncbi:hypothetical protein ANCCEY_01772 [Ancylostoma ceylanicum]|uniref:Neurotransmitter-gated ion-channel ligand-binding domain-containing protein n=1 Tax=Ancylostoma ceylanicum TaxID=53326 RepID=A0A0D6M6K9_9BILA|nr:hypothetical protein ANCCEY_01772 [Ancylostoma ceylanicum]